MVQSKRKQIMRVKAKRCCFEKINKINKPMADHKKRKKNKLPVSRLESIGEYLHNLG